MSKRKVAFSGLSEGLSEEPDWKRSNVGEAGGEESKGERLRTFKPNHTLDSDDEGEDDAKTEEQYGVKEEDVVEGAEDPTIAVDEGMKVTPFNLREEMSEGRFDSDGNYFAKKEDDVRDNWLDNIDWVQIKEPSKAGDADDTESQEADPEARPEPEVFTEILELLKPGETITKALQRLGGGKKKLQQRRHSKKAKREAPGKENKEEEEESSVVEDPEKRKADLLKLTGLADDIICRGNYEVYGYTYERIQHLLKSRDEKQKEKDDAAFDMFGEEVEESKLAKPTPEANADLVTISDDINWEFKWEDKEDVKIYGPYTSRQMQDWVEQDYFKDGVYVRKVGRDQNFHSSRRVDFELYT